MKIFIPKIAVKSFTYLLILVGALYFAAPSIISQETPNPADKKELSDKENPNQNPEENAAPVAKEEAPAPAKSNIGLVDLFVTGGWSMWPLLFSSIIALGIIFERLYFFTTTKLVTKGYNQDLDDAIQTGGLEGAQKFIEEHADQKISIVLKGGMEVSQNDPEIFSQGVEREAGEVLTLLEKGLVVLAAVSTVAPLIGFLGTVSGMINAFDAIANADQVNAKVVAGGIKESLITTATGLIVAIPAMVFYQYLTSRVNAFTASVEEAANKIYKEFLKKKASKVGA